MTMEQYIFAGFIGLMAFALLFWYKRTPRAKLPRKEAEELAEKEAKLFKLYQNLEDMMDSFESYVQQQTEQIKGNVEAMAAAEKRVDELAGLMETALHNADGRWDEASAMMDKAELLANELADRINRNMADLEHRQQHAVEELDREIKEKLRAAKENAARLIPDGQPSAQQQPGTRRIEPIVARPAEEAQPAIQQPQVIQPGRREHTVPPVSATPSATDIPFTPIIGKGETQPQPSGSEPGIQPVNEVQAQLLKKLAEAKKSRHAQPDKKPVVAEAHFEATVPEFDIAADMAVAAGSEKYATYSRPAAIQKAKAQPSKERQGEASESRKQQVLDLYKEGMSAEEISRQLGVAKGAISFILDLQGKLQ